MLRRAFTTVVCLVFLPATVQAFDHHHHHHHHGHSGGHDGGGCGGASSEESGGSTGGGPTAQPAPRAPSPAPTAGKRAFVTSTAYAGAIGGLDAADGYCTSSAHAAGLSGTYRAWLSAGSTRASDRIDGAGPWFTTRGELAFASHDALGAPPATPLRDENGRAPSPGAAPWSGTNAAGDPTGEDCDGWTNATSEASGTVDLSGAALACDAKAPLLCFEE